MNVWQFCMLVTGVAGFWLARWQYNTQARADIRRQAVCGVYYAQELAGRRLEEWEVRLLSGGNFATYGQYLNAKESSQFLPVPFKN
ncbi:MAG: hypothetical protein A2W79_07040 [Pseudomonadales bacterium RIFCSPLOWO2_12_60_38]|jgi:hypothetical protein|uniref:hypothetical protein n=1 Tax=Pseudomonas fluorescens group TaxID=136843 RepID=UPI0008C8F8C6|nr:MULTISPECIES: hypothetical protein [Pseudomonas fluorescens group]MCM2379634.1 hypothetical protein [Pseudomonas marginalis]NMX51733.1 hypothetical protein [Pseudomonas veronii]OHC32628.1 MAG: hypothetical protein A2W79_07040 [Pseudomonadales bacterium RIFCSPLOWO2_12_60_38]OHC37307.1 MAG: hypothetical protein A3G72_26210 [Pseudomonadales bacterium RIFCSPLOWO2_12_FULL_59_450]